jgi:Domain of unknown function (DUF927)
MNTVDFLRHVLADDGWICIDIKLKKGVRHKFFLGDFEQAAAYVQAQDARGETVYFACATFKTSESRRQVNVAYLKSIFGDVDVGPDKPYKTRGEASAALTKFLVDTSWPVPTIVYSGAVGMHLYWVFEEPLAPELWKPIAEAFRELCKRHGFHLDHTRTADSASVLRPPGTHNRKRGSDDLVTVAHVSTPLWRGDLPLLFKPHMQQRAISKPGSLLEGASAYSDVPSDAHKIAIACAQIGNLRNLKGNIPYDQWLYSIWTLHFTTQGDDIAHEWSAGHPNYTHEETQRKLDEATNPIKCTTFAQHNDLCKSCAHWGKIGTPLQLGRDVFVGRQQEIVGADPVRKTAVTKFNIYTNDKDGLWLTSEDKKGQPSNTLISARPITLNAVCRGERDHAYSLVFSMTTPHMGEVPIAIAAAEFFSAVGMPLMHKQGAVIHHPDYFRDYVRKSMDEYHENHAPQTQYSQFGWKDHDNAFLFGNKLYTQSQTITTTGSPEIERRARMLGPRSGSLAAWTAAANKLFAAGCEPHSFALCCAFGAPLMRFLSEEEGGAIVNLVSESSATGKTTGLEAVASVWGELDGLRLLDEDTQISRGVFLGTLGNLPCVFDELHKRDPDSIRTFVTMFTSGRDKLRAKADGTLRDPSGDWQTVLILGSNISLVDIMQSKNSEEAQAFRILELITEQTFTGNEGDRLRRQLNENRGWAGDAFIRYLMQPGMLAAVRAELDNVVAALWQPEYGFAKQHRFWVRAIACALAAGRIITHMGLLDFNTTRVIEWVINRCHERRDSETKRDNVQVLNEALYDLWASTLVVDVEWKPQTACFVLCAPNPNRPFLARRVRDSGRMYVTRTWLRKWLVAHGINRTAFTNDLKKRRVIVNDNKFVTLGAGTDHGGGGQVVCFEIDLFHPHMTGALESAERDVPEEEKAKKPISSLRPPGAPGAGAPSPPSTLQ